MSDNDTLKTDLDDSATCSPSEEQVVEFLQQNPEFFVHQTSLLNSLKVPHHAAGTISLVERQVASLREENQQLKHKLAELIGNARDNDALYEMTQNLILDLLDADNVDDFRRCIEVGITERFHLDYCRFSAIGQSADDATESTITPKQLQEVLPRFSAQRIYCGPLHEEEACLLFPKHYNHIGSVALIPITTEDQDNTTDGEEHTLLAFLVIASKDAEYYRDNMSTALLSALGKIVSRLFIRLQP